MAKAGDPPDNPFARSWRVAFGALRERGQSIGHPFGRTGWLIIHSAADNGLTITLDPDRSGQNFDFPGTWTPGTPGGVPPSMRASFTLGGRTYNFFGYLRQDTPQPRILGQLQLMRVAETPTEDSDADGSWIAGDDEPEG